MAWEFAERPTQNECEEERGKKPRPSRCEASPQ